MSLVSPGTQVTITDESMYIPADQGTVALFVIATAAEKTNPSGLAAAGTYEHDVVRTVTSIKQSGDLYGAPTFLKDASGQHLHGDARNEYGLLALNNFLGVANLAYVIRANVNLDDTIEGLRNVWGLKMQEAAYVLENLTNNFLSTWNATNNYIPSDPSYRTTISQPELAALGQQALSHVWEFSSFANSENDFFNNHSAVPLNIYANGYDAATTGQYLGFVGKSIEWVQQSLGTVVGTEWTPSEAGNMLIQAGDEFKFTREFKNKTSLGANDAARRAAIVTALKRTIASNQDIRSETYEYSLVVCPGYYEVITDLVGLSQDLQEEVFVVADTPFDLDPDETAVWAMTSARVNSTTNAYYYPHVMMTNQFTGETVFGPASAAVMRTYAYSDSVSEPWFAPAGAQRGIVANVAYVGYVAGDLGTATQVVETALNRGQRDNLYKPYTSINPIVFFPGRGLLVFGQKTSSGISSARDRVNVERLLMNIRRMVRKETLPFIFQPNDVTTRDQAKAMIDGRLADIMIRRGLYDYATQCDTGNNTPDRIDRNELWIDIALKPMKSVEFIYVPIRVVNTGTSI